MRLSLVAAACAAISCSFTTATGFNECALDTDCLASATCIEHYCIRLAEGCTRAFGDFSKSDNFKLAAIMPLTDTAGVQSKSQDASLKAYTMALNELNGTAGARPLALYVCDSQSNDDRAEHQATFLAQQLKVPAIFTGGSAQTLRVSSATVDAGTMIMSPRATSPALVDAFHAQADNLLWRTAPPDTLQGRVLADLILSDAGIYAGANTVGIIFLNDSYGQGLNRELASRLSAAGRNVSSSPFSAGDDAGIASAVQFIASKSPNVTVAISFSDDTQRILNAAFGTTQLKRAAGNKWAFADGSKSPTILNVPGALAEIAGSLGTAPAQGAGSVYMTFQQSYQTQYMIDPGTFAFTSHSYDAMYLVGLAAAFASSGGRAPNGKTMAGAMNMVSDLTAGTKLTIEPINITAMRNALVGGTSINIEGNSGSLDFIPDAGAPFAKIEEWRIETDGGFSTVGLIDPPPN